MDEREKLVRRVGRSLGRGRRSLGRGKFNSYFIYLTISRFSCLISWLHLHYTYLDKTRLTDKGYMYYGYMHYLHLIVDINPLFFWWICCLNMHESPLQNSFKNPYFLLFTNSFFRWCSGMSRKCKSKLKDRINFGCSKMYLDSQHRELISHRNSRFTRPWIALESWLSSMAWPQCYFRRCVVT